MALALVDSSTSLPPNIVVDFIESIVTGCRLSASKAYAVVPGIGVSLALASSRDSIRPESDTGIRSGTRISGPCRRKGGGSSARASETWDNGTSLGFLARSVWRA